MNNKISFLLGPALLASIIALMLAGCIGAAPIITPASQSPTATPPYLHYIPPKASNIHLEFDYPGSWVFREGKIQGTDFIVIDLGDSRFRTLPTRSPDEPHGTPIDFGSVDIRIEPVKPSQTLDKLVESYKQGHSDISWIAPLNDYKTKLDGYDARVLEYKIEPLNDNGYSSLMFERDTFFAVKDQIYQIAFIVAAKERGGEFEKSYEYFFNSLKIIL